MNENQKLAKSTPANFKKIHSVDWNLIDNIDPMVLKVTNDRKTMKQIVKNFLNANALFKDPSYCPPDLILKYFQILQVSVAELVDENNYLRKSLNEKTQEARKTKLELQKSQTINMQEKAKTQNLSKTIFQCPFCPKAYYTQNYVHKHISKDHQADVNRLTKSAPIRHKKSHKSKKDNEDIDILKGELQAMFDKFDTTTRLEQQEQYSRYAKRFRNLEEKIDNLGHENKFKRPLISRKQELMNSFAIYSDQNSSSETSHNQPESTHSNDNKQRKNDQYTDKRQETSTLGEGTVDLPTEKTNSPFVIESSNSLS